MLWVQILPEATALSQEITALGHISAVLLCIYGVTIYCDTLVVTMNVVMYTRGDLIYYAQIFNHKVAWHTCCLFWLTSVTCIRNEPSQISAIT